MIIKEELELTNQHIPCKYLVEIKRGVDYLFIFCDEIIMINNELILLVNGFLKQKIDKFDYWFVHGLEEDFL